jgi:histidinol phosphatase-like PHP family hydrolase
VNQLSRRSFLTHGAAVAAALGPSGRLIAAEAAGPDKKSDLSFPLVDYHVHRDNTTLDKLLEISRQKGVKFGIVEHAGIKAIKYPVMLSTDDELKRYITSLEGKPVYKGIQAEYVNWMDCFSKEVVAQLDYVLTDAMTIRQDGKPQKMWEPGLKIGNTQRFMDAYVDFYVEILTTEPIDILANASWLPGAISKEYDALWSEKRVQKVVDAAVKYGVAIEISSSLCLPKLLWLKMAKEAGVRFSFGSNIRGPEVGKMDYCVEMAKKLGLTREQMFTPAPAGKKAIERRG